jgi:hypothetical protein
VPINSGPDEGSLAKDGGKGLNMKLSQLEQSAIHRLQNGARIRRTFANEISLQKWVDMGLAKWIGNVVGTQMYVIQS